MKPTSAAAFQHLLLLLLLLATEIYGHRFSTSLSLGCFHPNHTNCLFVYRKHFVPILTYAEAWEACEARLSRLAQFRTEGQFGWFRRQFARVRDEICCAQDTCTFHLGGHVNSLGQAVWEANSTNWNNLKTHIGHDWPEFGQHSCNSTVRRPLIPGVEVITRRSGTLHFNAGGIQNFGAFRRNAPKSRQCHLDVTERPLCGAVCEYNFVRPEVHEPLDLTRYNPNPLFNYYAGT